MKYLLLLDGVADIYLFPQNGTHRWDTCAGTALLHCVAGCCTDSYGKQYDYGSDMIHNHSNNNGVLASRDVSAQTKFMIQSDKKLSKF